MVDDYGQFGYPVDKLEHDRKMLWPDKQVVRNATVLEFPKPAHDVIAEQPAVVRLVVYRMAHSAETRVTLQRIEPVAKPRVRQIDPHDHAEHERVLIG